MKCKVRVFFFFIDMFAALSASSFDILRCGDSVVILQNKTILYDSMCEITFKILIFFFFLKSPSVNQQIGSRPKLTPLAVRLLKNRDMFWKQQRVTVLSGSQATNSFQSLCITLK